MQTKYLEIELPDFCETPCKDFRVNESIMFKDGERYSTYSCKNELICTRLKRRKLKVEEIE